MSRRRMRAHTCLEVIVVAAALCAACGCGRGFYLAESDAAGIAQNFRTASDANEQLTRMQDKIITIQFDSSGTVPHIQSTNLLEVLRDTTNLVFADDVLHQVSLARVSRQIERQADAWASERLSLLQQSGGHEVRLKNLQRVTINVLSPPVVSYNVLEQSVNFQTQVRLTLSGTILVNVDEGIFGPILDLFHPNPNGEWAVDVQLDNYTLQGQLRLGNPFRDATTVRLQVQPRIGSITVIGNAPGEVNDGIRQLLSAQLSSPVDITRALDFKNFSLADASVRPGSSENTLNVSYLPRPRRSQPILDVITRGEDNLLYHARRKDNAWRDFAALSALGAVASDPALVASGADQLELVVVHPDGGLYHLQWSGNRWSTGERIALPGGGRFAAQKPVLLATAPGQWEAIAAAGDGSLWHIRRLNGRLLAPALIPQNAYVSPPQLPLRDPVAAQVGNKIALLYIDSRNLLYGSEFDLETGHWSLTQSISTRGSVQFAPAVASCGGGRLEVVYAGDGQHPYHRPLLPSRTRILANLQGGGFDLGDEVEVGGTLSASPALTCSGYEQMELMGRGTDNVAYHNHFVGPNSAQGAIDGRQIQPGWQGWTGLGARFFGTVFLSGTVSASLAVDSTRNGEVSFVALQQSSGASPLMFDSFDSRRFARTEWDAVGWRGLEQVGTRHLTGIPAVAVSDRLLQVWTADSDASLHSVALMERNIWEVPGLATSAVGLGAAAAVLSSAPGEVDVLSVDPQGNLHFSRSYNDRDYAQFPLGRPSGSGVFAIAAVSSGPGLIDLVTVSSDRSLHHWRKLYDRWQDPVTISGSVISAPVLVSTGAGQLELLAIGGDHKLYRWRFANGSWAGWQQIEGNLQLSTMLGQQSASSWGDGSVDLVVVEDSTRGMFHMRLLPLAPQASGVLPAGGNTGFDAVGGKTTDIAMIAAEGPDQLTILARGTDGYLYENQSKRITIRRPTRTPRRGRKHPETRLTWPGFKPLTSTTAVFGGMALLPDGELALLAERSNTAIALNRRRNQQWNGFLFLPQVSNQDPFRPLLLRY